MPETPRGRITWPVVLIDTREQLPYEFPNFTTRLATLKTGDYSLEGYESQVCVERKTKEDAYGCVGGSRRRFVECLHRLAEMRRGCVVIECTFPEFLIPPPYTRVSGAQAGGSFLSWSCQYRVPVFWPGSREVSERVTIRWLAAYLKHLAVGQHEKEE